MAGCYACHGVSEEDGRVNFRRLSSGAFRSKAMPTFWDEGVDDLEALKTWIRDGAPGNEREQQDRLLMRMPAYGQFYSEEDIDAMAAWIVGREIGLSGGAGNAEREVPEDLMLDGLAGDALLALGDRISRQQGCYQCHGELGQGGVENPLSFKGSIPGFFGDAFRELTDGGKPEEILHWIDHGRGLAVEKGLRGTFAKRFFDQQAIGMPGYGGLIRESEKAVLVAYLLALNEMGPLDAAALLDLAELLASNVAADQIPD